MPALSKALYAPAHAMAYMDQGKRTLNMKTFFAALAALILSAGLLAQTAEAARVGSGRSMGIQRSAPVQRQATPPAAAPQQANPSTPAPAPAGNRWLGPLAGLAAGLGLGW